MTCDYLQAIALVGVVGPPLFLFLLTQFGEWKNEQERIDWRNASFAAWTFMLILLLSQARWF